MTGPSAIPTILVTNNVIATVNTGEKIPFNKLSGISDPSYYQFVPNSTDVMITMPGVYSISFAVNCKAIPFHIKLALRVNSQVEAVFSSDQPGAGPQLLGNWSINVTSTSLVSITNETESIKLTKDTNPESNNAHLLIQYLGISS